MISHVVAIPDVTLSLNSSSSIDQTVLAAFVLLLLLTLVQAALLLHSIYSQVEQTKSIWNAVQVGLPESCTVYRLLVLLLPMHALATSGLWGYSNLKLMISMLVGE